MILPVVGCFGALLRNTSSKTELHANLSVGPHTALNSFGKHHQAPCRCEANNALWKAPNRTVPKCVFIDLGAANGNTFEQFMQNYYGPVKNCPSQQWEAFLVEANPKFTPDLQAENSKYPTAVHSMHSTAAYMCQGTTSFSIDPDVAHNHWGSSMKVGFEGSQEVTVPMINVMQLIAEHTIPADWVMLKVDVEGAEYDIIPCLAQFQKANLVDRMYLEEHHWLEIESVYSAQEFEQAKTTLKTAGVDIPQYFTHTM